MINSQISLLIRTTSVSTSDKSMQSIFGKYQTTYMLKIELRCYRHSNIIGSSVLH